LGRGDVHTAQAYANLPPGVKVKSKSAVNLILCEDHFKAKEFMNPARTRDQMIASREL